MIEQAVDGWLSTPSLSTLIERLGGKAPEGGALLDRCVAIAAFTQSNFDFRGRAGQGAYRERWQAAEGDVDDELRQAVLCTADDLNMFRETRPSDRDFDAVLVLGGGRFSPRLRCEYAHELVEALDIAAPVYLLGSPRTIDEVGERPATDTYAPGARTEFDLMCRGAELAFSLDDAEQLEFRSTKTPLADYREWMVRTYRLPGRRVVALSAPSSEPQTRRPNTADTYEFLTRWSGAHRGSKVLVVTTQVFVPFQYFDALRMLQLPHGVDVTMAGFGPERGDRPLTAEYFLQEINSGVQSALRLLRALAPA